MKLNLLAAITVTLTGWVVWTDDYGTGFADGEVNQCRMLTDGLGEMQAGVCRVPLTVDGEVVWERPELEIRWRTP